jgi:hypothetical protein
MEIPAVAHASFLQKRCGRRPKLPLWIKGLETPAPWRNPLQRLNSVITTSPTIPGEAEVGLGNTHDLVNDV